MSNQPRGRRNLVSVLKRHLGQRTVLGVAMPVLAGHIDALDKQIEFQGLLEMEIIEGFRKLAAEFLHCDYHPTYVQRRLGPRGFLEVVGDRYRFREPLLTGLDRSQLVELQEELDSSLRSATEQRQAVIKKIEEACALPREQIQERRELVDAYLSQLTGNCGELFEVVSFAVLREYFRSFGFSLQRFSTTLANDGGMDYVGGDAIYQVTVDESVEKIRRDLRKLPGVKRVLVRPTVTPEIAEQVGPDVLTIVELRDLLDHFVAWLLQRDSRSKQAKHLQEILTIALHEFRRESRAEGS